MVFPILTIFPITAPVGHFGTAWSKPFKYAKKGRYKIALTVIGVMFLIFTILLMVLPFVVAVTVVADSVLTFSEIKQGILGGAIGVVDENVLTLSEVKPGLVGGAIGIGVCGVGAFLCWSVGIGLSWAVYRSTNRSYRASQKRDKG